MQTTKILKETLIYPADLPGHPNRRTVYRWRKGEGRQGRKVTLEWCYLAGRVVTSREAFERFVKRINGELRCLSSLNSLTAVGE